MRQIVDIQLHRLEQRLADRHLILDFTDAARDYLANRGYDPVYGARPLKRAIQQEVETPLAQQLIAGTVRDGTRVHVDVKPGGGLAFEVEGDARAESA